VPLVSLYAPYSLGSAASSAPDKLGEVCLVDIVGVLVVDDEVDVEEEDEDADHDGHDHQGQVEIPHGRGERSDMGSDSTNSKDLGGDLVIICTRF